MRYSFEFEDNGETTTVDLPMADAPEFGSRRKINGRYARRIIDVPGAVQVAPSIKYTSHALPRNWPFAPRVDAKGRPQFESRQEVREAEAKANHQGENVSWD